MTPRERVKAAMDRATVDRVPVMCQFSFGHMLLQTGQPAVEFWHDAGRFAQGLVELRSIYDFDGILVSLHGHDSFWRQKIASRFTTNDGEHVQYEDGRELIFPPDDLPRPSKSIRPPARSINSMTEKDILQVLDYIPVSQGVHFSLDQDRLFDVFHIVRDKAGPDYSIHGEVTSPFDYFLDYFGHQEGLMNLIDAPEASQRILAHFATLISDLAAEMCNVGIDAIKVSSPFAGSAFISRDFYKKFVLPYEAGIVHTIRRKGIHVYTHTCGTIKDRLDLILESGVTGIECLDPPPLGDVDLAEAMSQIGNRGFIKGNIDSVNTLLGKTKEEILKDLRDRVLLGRENKGYILSTACSVAPRVEREHLLLLREAVQQWG